MSFSNISIAILAGIVPSVIWLLFWLREDALHPEPKDMIAAAFFGGIVVVILAVFGEQYVSIVTQDQSWRYIFWASLEEILKFAVFAALIWNSKYFDEPIDAMIYMITISLGFAAIENALFVLKPISEGNLLQSVATGSMRFLGATLVHIVSSAIIGFSIGYVFYRDLLVKGVFLMEGLLTAIILHSLFNLSIINSTAFGALGIFVWIWVSVVILILLFEEIKAVGKSS